jgi:hypothetical protein
VKTRGTTINNSSTTTTTKRSDSRFQSRYDVAALVDVVAAVARLAKPERPERVSQRAYNAARAAAGYADAPTAKQTAARLGMGWSELLAFALEPAASREIALGRRLGQREEPWLGEDDVRAALKTVALRLKKKTLMPAEYRQERERMLDEAGRAWRHQGELALPTEGQIERVAGSWDDALVMAGLKRREHDHSTHRGVAVIDAIELFLEAYGALPTTVELEAFARRQGFPMSQREMSHSEAIEQLRYRRLEWGKWTPLSIPRKRDRPDYSSEVKLPKNVGGVGSRRKRWTREACLEALARLIEETAGERLTQRKYQELSARRTDLPPLSSLQQHGRWSEIVADARQARLSRSLRGLRP